MTDPIVAAIIGAVTGVVGVVATQVAVVYTQHVRTLRAGFLERQLRDGYAPIDYWLSVLVDPSSVTDARTDAANALRSILQTHGYILSATVRAELYRLLAKGPSSDGAAETFLQFREEYEDLVSMYRRHHFVGADKPPVARTVSRRTC